MKLPNLFKKKQKATPLEAVKLFADTFSLTQEDLEKLAGIMSDRVVEMPAGEIQGNGKAEFLAPMSDAEYARYMHEETHGWKGVYNKLLGRGEQ